MNKSFFPLISKLLLCLLYVVSCDKIESIQSPYDGANPFESTNHSLETKSNSQIYYHSGTGLLIHQTIDNDDKLELGDASVTHVVRKYYPKSVEEQFEISNCEEIEVSYIPIGYSPVNLRTTNSIQIKNGDYPLFPENHSNTIHLNTRDAHVDTIRGELLNTSDCEYDITLPVMYAICPIDFTGLQSIQQEDCYGLCRAGGPGGMEYDTRFPIHLQQYDNLLDSLIPLAQVKIRAQNSNHLLDRYTTSLGDVNFNLHYADVSPSDMGSFAITIILETPKWIISRDSTTTPIHINLGSVNEIWPFYLIEPTVYTPSLTTSNIEFKIHRAAHHYHYISHDLSNDIDSYESGVVLHAFTDSHPSYAGLSWVQSKIIYVYNYSSMDNYIIGTTLHELGHIRQYAKMGASFSSAASIIKESYASFIGWYVGEHYYLSKGFTRPYPTYHINGQSRQSWHSGIGSTMYPYSPLFIDMVDDVNQGLNNNNYPYDLISGVPVSTVEQMGWQNTSLSGCFQYLENYSGIYFSLVELNNYKTYYNE